MDGDGTELLRRIREGDARAFHVLFMAHYARLCTVADRYVDSLDVAEDLVQEVFLAIWMRREEWEVPHGVRAYLYTAVRNRALNALRDRAQTVAHEDVPESIAPGQDADVSIDQRELERAVRRAVAALPDRCRQVFLMQREGGMTYGQVASALGISIKTVETQMGRALAALREALAPYRG